MAAVPLPLQAPRSRGRARESPALLRWRLLLHLHLPLRQLRRAQQLQRQGALHLLPPLLTKIAMKVVTRAGGVGRTRPHRRYDRERASSEREALHSKHAAP